MNQRFHLTWFTAIGLFLLVCPMSQANARACAVSARLQRYSNISLPAPESAPSRGSWKIVPSRNPGGPHNSFNYLSGVATISPNDVWAVGFYSSSNNIRKTLIEHWNGTQWSVAPGSNPGMSGNELTAVAVVSPNNIWAVGDYYNSDNVFQTLIEHWNGSRWSVVPSPNVGTERNVLKSVAAVSAHDVWAVGYIVDPNSNISRTLIEHWNGRRWSIIPSPSPGTYYNELLGVAAVSASDIWAVGFYNLHDGGNLTLTEQWNGKKWSIVTSPSPNGNGQLSGVVAVSASNTWAIGSFTNGPGVELTLIEHWNGTRWKAVPSPNPGSIGSMLFGVAALTASDIWAVGFSIDSNERDHTLIERWNGTKWRVVASPNMKKNCGNGLFGVAAISASDAWTVGVCFYSATLTEHYS